MCCVSPASDPSASRGHVQRASCKEGGKSSFSVRDIARGLFYCIDYHKVAVEGMITFEAPSVAVILHSKVGNETFFSLFC